ncbi:hypothetical protein [Kocuria palustris]|uniref:hypothetical protein n=1 Tax=Kocuria palustris TaxID=71999 RepID=UPI0021B2067F|nr:hypothetical protein [Kocuria palustris]
MTMADDRGPRQAPADEELSPEQRFEAELTEAGWLLPTLGEGITGTGAVMEAVVQGLILAARERAVDLPRPGRLEAVRFPPVNGRSLLERTDYVASFPQLLGTIDIFEGDTKAHRRLLADREAGQPWDGHMTTSGFALVPAACHPLYASLQRGRSQGVVDGTVHSLIGDCFRNEPSPDPLRFVSFRMLEFVLVGTPEQAVAHREAMLELGAELLRDLGLDVEVESANDPFFGRAGVMLAKGQRDAELKFEITAPIYESHRTAIASGNYHEDHFGAEFELRTEDGRTAHSACFGFGLERVALALARAHGPDIRSWPEQVCRLLGLPAGEAL